MTWISNLALTYDEAQRLPIGDLSKKPLPIHHDQQVSHLNVSINGSGKFLSATVEEESIVLPATEASAGRTSNIAPHALADNLRYVAADCRNYVSDKQKKRLKQSFESYVKQLAQWCDSPYRHESVVAVLRYIKRRTLVIDLLKNSVLILDEEIDLNLETKGNKTIVSENPLLKLLTLENGRRDQSKALVRWSVEKRGKLETRTWLDSTVQKSWQDFVNSRKFRMDLCYGTGVQDAVRSNHPKKLRYSSDSAKLISANDFDGFTFRGRFTDNEKPVRQAVNVGDITSQKAHSALRWLINRNHGTYTFKEHRIVSWANTGIEIPTPQTDFKKLSLDDFTEQTVAGDEDVEDCIDHSIDLGKIYSKRLRDHLSGYRSKLSAVERISILALDSATPGRMAISYYREFLSDEYFNEISKWYEEFAWYQLTVQEEGSNLNKKKVSWLIRTPTPQEIVQVLYGNSLKGQPNLRKNFFQRIIPVVVERSQIPVDFVQLATEHARNPVKFEKDYQWQKALGVACSLLRGFFFRHPLASKRKEIPMSLDSSNTSRDYLYGRLLAVADRLEGMHLYLTDSKRSTAAHRLMVRFSSHPYSTWPIIYKHLIPYMQHLEKSREGFLQAMKNELDEIMSLFKHDEFTSDERLSGEFLLGYHLQRIALRPRAKKSDEQSES